VEEYACAILLDGNRLLLGRRSAHRRAYAGCWDVIGGRVEPGEALHAALARELEEELGIAPTQYRPLVALRDTTQRGEATYHFFTVTAWRGGAPAIRDDEHSELGWFTVDEACALDGLAIEEYRMLFRTLGLA